MFLFLNFREKYIKKVATVFISLGLARRHAHNSLIFDKLAVVTRKKKQQQQRKQAKLHASVISFCSTQEGHPTSAKKLLHSLHVGPITRTSLRHCLPGQRQHD